MPRKWIMEIESVPVGNLTGRKIELAKVEALRAIAEELEEFNTGEQNRVLQRLANKVAPERFPE